jgi:hypothetical protein
MSDRRAPFAVTAGLIGLACLGGCTHSGGSTSSSGPTDAGHVAHGANAAFTAGQLKKALLVRINGVEPESAPDSGTYASLPAIKTAQAQMAGTTITPKDCAQATVLQAADLDTGALDAAPAAVANFRINADSVSEVLAQHRGSAAVTTLADSVPAGCAHYTAAAGGKKYEYTVKQDMADGIGMQPARIVNISSPEQALNVWSVLFRGDGFVGAITVAGPNASEAVARELGQQAYAYAAQSLA